MLKIKVIIKVFLFVLCIGCCLLLFIVSQIKFEKETDRNVVTYSLTSDLKERTREMCNDSDSPEKIIKECSGFACKELSFSAKNNIQCGKANCVGYAQLTSAIINYAFQVKKLPYKAKPVVGKVYLFGIDLNNVAQQILPQKYRPFFKDHDFVEIDLGDKTIYVDSSLQDLTGYKFYQTKIAN